MKAVLITWYDAVSSDEWTEVSEAKTQELATVRTLGWLVDEDERRIIVAPSWDVDNDNVATYWTIPKTWLLEIQDIDVEL